jgi:hypothetical protein
MLLHWSFSNKTLLLGQAFEEQSIDKTARRIRMPSEDKWFFSAKDLFSLMVCRHVAM